MKRLLFLGIGPYFVPHEIPVREKYKYLSKHFSGDILAIVHKKEFRNAVLGNFVLRGLYLPQRIQHSYLMRDIAYGLFAISFCLYKRFFKKNNYYDVIVCYDPFVTGVLALIIGKLTGAKFIVEVNGNYQSAFKLDSVRPGLLDHLKHRYTAIVAPFVLKRADGVKLLYQNQLNSFGLLSDPKRFFVFPNFVPISHFKHAFNADRYILFLGYPWFLKGVDILIKAFNTIYKEFPDYRLKIVGYCPDKTEFIKLASGNDQIEFCDPVWYGDVIKLMSECALFVLPSRTDASPRVLREAMASKKPIIASNVDGIPSLIKDGETGLLFESEKVDQLAHKMKTLLSDPEYAARLAENGFRYVHTELSEERYTDRFSQMIGKVLEKDAV